jgi:hypothetical protein
MFVYKGDSDILLGHFRLLIIIPIRLLFHLLSDCYFISYEILFRLRPFYQTFGDHFEKWSPNVLANNLHIYSSYYHIRYEKISA